MPYTWDKGKGWESGCQHKMPPYPRKPWASLFFSITKKLQHPRQLWAVFFFFFLDLCLLGKDQLSVLTRWLPLVLSQTVFWFTHLSLVLLSLVFSYPSGTYFENSNQQKFEIHGTGPSYFKILKIPSFVFINLVLNNIHDVCLKGLQTKIKGLKTKISVLTVGL